MNKITLASGAIIIGIALFIGGVLMGQANAQEFQPGSMMGAFSGNAQQDCGGMGSGYSIMGSQYGGMMGMMGDGMMNGIGGVVNVDPQTIEQAETAVSDYLDTLNDDNLILGEIMIFDNHAYAQVLNDETGQGAFEVLVDPVSGKVFPEPGPNMMWNTENGMMGGGMMGGQYGGMMGRGMMNGKFGNMVGNFGIASGAEISVTEEDAVRLAQEYLDNDLPGTNADDHADSFPGYYTIHIEQDGEVIGMLSVNAYNGQVFLHHWHGEFIEMTSDEHD